MQGPGRWSVRRLKIFRSFNCGQPYSGEAPKKINIRETPNSKQTNLPFGLLKTPLWLSGATAGWVSPAPEPLASWSDGIWTSVPSVPGAARRHGGPAELPTGLCTGNPSSGLLAGGLRFAQPPGTGAQASGGGSEATNELGNSSSRLWPLAETVQLCPGAKAAFPFPHQPRLRLRPSPSQTCGVWRMKQ